MKGVSMQHRVSRWTAVFWAGIAAAAFSACSSSSTTQKPAPPAPAAQTAAPPPSPAGVVHEQPLAKTNPDVVEETPAYSVQRFKKSDMVRVDEHRIRYPFTTIPMAIYREDADYYYVRTEKVTPEEMN